MAGRAALRYAERVGTREAAVGRGLAGGLAVAALWLALGACGTGTEKVISTEELERGVSDALKQADRVPEKVRCEGPMKAQIAEATQCVMTADGADYRLEVIVTAIENGKATYDIDVSANPMS